MIRARLRDLLGFWARYGIDPASGGFIGRLDAEGRPAPDPHKRFLVQARQIYAFSTAARLGAGTWALEIAERGYAWIVAHAWDRKSGGWFHTLTPAGEPLDRRKDLYDHAFAIFALAHLARANGAAEPRERAHQTYELLRERLADPAAGGFFEAGEADWTPIHEPRRQNPHMHLVEALLALGERGEAGPLVALCAERFIDSRGWLSEVFDAQWRRDARESVIEPGHHFEWVWLLGEYGGADAAALADRLWSAARASGVGAEGLVVDGVDRNGRVVRPTRRLWPQMEHWKACVSRGVDPPLRPVVAAYVDPCGGWAEQLDADGAVCSEWMNATSVYHVTNAISECLTRAGAVALSR